MKGSCLCGAIRISLSAPVKFTEICHCGSCRRAAGAPLMVWACVPRAGVEIEGEALRCFDSSPEVERTFCGNCGSSLTLWDRSEVDDLYIAVGILEDAEDCAPDFHIWRSERLSWLETTDALPRYLRFKRDSLLE